MLSISYSSQNSIRNSGVIGVELAPSGIGNLIILVKLGSLCGLVGCLIHYAIGYTHLGPTASLSKSLKTNGYIRLIHRGPQSLPQKGGIEKPKDSMT